MKEIFKTFKEEDFFENVNLHIHSNLSDGKSSVEEIYEKFKHLKYFSITDHNDIESYKFFEGKNCQNYVIGVEFDCWFRGVLVHILGYGFDPNNENLKKFFAKNQKSKTDTITRLVEARNPKEVIKAIKEAGGIAILAHPACYWCINLDNFVKRLIPYGLDGLEVFYPYRRHRGIIKFHFQKTVRKIAEKYNLLMSGGTDEHGRV